MGKTRDIFKKIRDTKGTFHAKMGFASGGPNIGTSVSASVLLMNLWD